MNRQPLVIAHRGFSARHLENTLPAIESAVRLGVDFVEIDVHETRDGEIIVFHDYRLNRICSVRGRVRDKTLAELKQINPDITSLSEVLHVCRGGTKLLIEIKRATPAKVNELITRHGMADHVIVFSMRIARLRDFASANPKIPRWGIIGRNLQFGLARFQSMVAGVALDQRLVMSRAVVERIHTRGLKLFVWTVNRVEEMRQLTNWGVDGLITDHPDRALNLRAP